MRQQQAKDWMYDIVRDELCRRFRKHPGVQEQLAEVEREVLEGRISSFRGANRLLDLYGR
jgi:LAO/AO transport system kinase